VSRPVYLDDAPAIRLADQNVHLHGIGTEKASLKKIERVSASNRQVRAMTDFTICDRVDHGMGQVTEMERSNPERGTPAG
jgi:hypothetical protein